MIHNDILVETSVIPTLLGGGQIFDGVDVKTVFYIAGVATIYALYSTDNFATYTIVDTIAILVSTIV